LAGDLDFEAKGSAPLFARDIRKFRGQLKVTPQQLRTVPHLFPEPINQFIPATLTLADGRVSVKELRANYGKDTWFLKKADIDLTALPREIVVRDFQGRITFEEPHPRYPEQVEKIFAKINPRKLWNLDADEVVIPLADPAKTTYRATLWARDGLLTLDDPRILIFNIDTQIRLVPGMATVEHLNAATLDGQVVGTGWVQTKPGGAYHFDTNAKGFELQKLVKALQKPGAKPVQINGKPEVVAHLDGFIPADKRPFMDAFHANGHIDVDNGYFYRIPLFEKLASEAKMNEDALTVGKAKTDFAIANRVVTLANTEVSAKLLTVTGDGIIGFDQKIDFHAVLVPGEKGEVENNKNFIGAGIAAIQEGVAKVSSAALYNVRVTGPVGDPKVSAETGELIKSVQGKN